MMHISAPTPPLLFRRLLLFLLFRGRRHNCLILQIDVDDGDGGGGGDAEVLTLLLPLSFFLSPGRRSFGWAHPYHAESVAKGDRDFRVEDLTTSEKSLEM